MKNSIKTNFAKIKYCTYDARAAGWISNNTDVPSSRSVVRFFTLRIAHNCSSGFTWNQTLRVVQLALINTRIDNVSVN